MVAAAFFAGARGVDAGQQAAARIARLDVRRNAWHELVVTGITSLHTIERFVVGGVALAPDGVRNARGGHEVAFVGGVQENAAAVGLAAFHGYGDDPCSVLADTLGDL